MSNFARSLPVLKGDWRDAKGIELIKMPESNAQRSFAALLPTEKPMTEKHTSIRFIEQHGGYKAGTEIQAFHLHMTHREDEILPRQRTPQESVLISEMERRLRAHNTQTALDENKTVLAPTHL